MITLKIALVMFLCHYVGDFLLQTRRVAMNKSKDVTCLMMHGGTVGITALVAMSMFSAPSYMILLATFIYTVTHCVQDWCVWGVFNATVAERWARNNEHFDRWFFRFLGLDQMLHMVLMFSVGTYLLG